MLLLQKEKAKLVFLFATIVGITVVEYNLRRRDLYYEYFFQALYFIPLVLSAFWYGLWGALAASGAITVFYLPFVLVHWKEFTPDEFESLLEILIYNAVAVVLGVLRNRDREQQRRLLEAERLASLGRATSGLAHDLKTPLVAIGGYTRLVMKGLAPDDPDRDKLATVFNETRRLEQMVSDMLDFSASLRLHKAERNIREIVAESIAVVQGIAAEKRVRLENVTADTLPKVKCDGMRIQQMLINLLTNAIDSSPEGMPVKVSAHASGANLIIDVVDSGAGIPPEQRRRIFDLFVTSKSFGTGLGLPIVKKIVEAHQGAIEILDNPGRGLIFRVKLPLASTDGCTRLQ